MKRGLAGSGIIGPVLGLLLLLAAGTGLWLTDGEGLLSLLVEESGLWPALLLSSLLYALLLSLPFVPGVELGWLIIGLFGRPGIFAAWSATVLGLCLGFACARLLRQHSYLQRLDTRRRALLATAPGELPTFRRLLQRCLVWHDRHPYLFVFFSLNIPGNWILGGGGGIAWISGSLPHTRLFPFFLTSIGATGIIPIILLLGSA